MQAAMVHGGGGVLLMMTTKFASQQTIKISQSYKTNAIKAPSLTTISNSKQNNTKLEAKTTIATNTLLLQSNLLPRSSSFK